LIGKVFVSLGQATTGEKDAAQQVGKLLKDEFHLTAYLAITAQGLRDIMRTTDELRLSDYYLFIDFKRRSLFTHQELALAHHLKFSEVIALQHQDAPPSEGFLRYMHCNPAKFASTPELVEKVRNLVKERGWTPNYSRNLVVNPVLGRSGGLTYGDHTGTTFHESWRAKIENRRPDIAAVGAVCILDSIRHPSGDSRPTPDRGYLKWVGHGSFSAYERILLPNTPEEIDICAVRAGQPGLFLLSTLDVQPRQPIVTENGDYELHYKVFARDFPMLEFSVKVHLQWEPAAKAFMAAGPMASTRTEPGSGVGSPTPTSWQHRSEVTLIE
jgi:hypothetical protein